MAQSNYIISPNFISPEPLEIIVDKYPGRNLVITDSNNKILLKVKPHDTTFHCQRLLVDDNDNPLALLRQKTSFHRRWHVFKGESKSDSDLIFSTKTEHALFQFKTNLCVMLGSRTRSDDDYDMKIKGCWSKGNLTVYIGDSSTAIAQLHRLQTSKKMKAGVDKFKVTIQANLDYAFVVALFAIVDSIENPEEVNNSNSGATGVAKTGLSVLNLVSNLAS